MAGVTRSADIASARRATSSDLRELSYRSREEQLPKDQVGQTMLAAIHSHFAARPYDFESCAVELWMMLAPATEELVVTQRSRDGGRDAIGRYRIGPPSDLVRSQGAELPVARGAVAEGPSRSDHACRYPLALRCQAV